MQVRVSVRWVLFIHLSQFTTNENAEIENKIEMQV